MPKSPNQKLKLLYLMEILLQQTDERHPMTVPEMITQLAQRGVSAERKSIYGDLEALRIFGLDIVQTKSKTTGYYVGTRAFETPELKLLVDSVQSSKFITHKKTLALIKKIEGLASIYDAQLLQRQVYVHGRVKSMNESVYYNVDEISDAISRDRQIRFHYFEYTISKQRRYRKEGAFYVVSPLALMWDNENYYLLAWDAKAALRKELSRDLTKDLAQLKDEYEHAKARAKAAGTELPTPPEETIDAQLEHLMTECDGHAETEDAAVLHARQRFEELCEEFEPEIKREAAAVREAGGLFIIGTERHESRRIDNQLRGRAGRQGDPGASRFFLSLEDDLMRIFGGERVQNLMDSLGLEEDVPIENKLITNTIESAQKKLEASNFAIRKQVLQYDDVMNQQREIIYKQRQMVLDGEDISDKLHEMMRQSIDDACTNYLNGETADDWDFAGLRRHFMNWLCLPSDFNYTKDQLEDLTKEGIADELYKRGMDILTAKEKKYGSKTMRELERICLLRNVDSKWMDHIDNMDQLKQGMGLRGYGQHDPVVEYRIEGFAMFDEMIASIREDAVHMLLTIEIRQQNAEPKREQIAKPTGEGATTQAGTKGAAPVRVTKIGRNDPCPCGSGLKWKKCTCKEYHPDL